ncbi:MAG: sodium/proton-translocating pyrophosphatase, partial [Planctomycetes bacterium]|nr:sodium/proton-translocating pyrophosphatase [Planctomycetota bacterium]
MTIPWFWWLAPIGSVVALFFARRFFKQVKACGEGDERMKEIAAHVREGAYAYLRRQYKVVLIFFVVVSAVLFIMGQTGSQHPLVFIAFLTGGFFSGLCGFLGMKTATMASNRTTQGAKEGLNRGLTIAFRAGAVVGLVVVGFGLLDISMWFLLLTKGFPWICSLLPGWFPNGFHMNLVEVTVVMLTFGMGASSQALFARVGGGIFTKAADVGADLVGKVEAGIPEDDPRNPATIADNVGDNVGDVAGMGADLYESYCGSILATAALGVAAVASVGGTIDAQVRMLAAPMVLAGVGILLSILGVYLVRTKEGASMKQLMGALGKGVNGASFLIILASIGVCYLLFGPVKNIEGLHWFGIWLSIVSGLVAGLIIGKSTEYYTSYEYKPTRNISSQAETGPATVIIA